VAHRVPRRGHLRYHERRSTSFADHVFCEASSEIGLRPTPNGPGGEQPPGWREEVFVEDVGRGWNMLRTHKWAYVEWDDGEQELYDMYTDRYQLQSLHAEPDKVALITRLSTRLDTLKRCSGESCRTTDTA
jgi:hypothetical protein